MTQSEKTTALLNGLDATDNNPQNLLDCFYSAALHAETLALKMDRITNLANTSCLKCGSTTHAPYVSCCEWCCKDCGELNGDTGILCAIIDLLEADT